MRHKRWTYAEAGVDIDRKSEAIESLVKQLSYRREGRGKRVDAKGQFTGLIDFGDLYLTMCTDGVGTKLLIAEELGIWDTVGIDCVAMNVNDTICVGAEPVAFVDYLAIAEPDDMLTAEIGKGLERGAALSNVDIVGGEIAVLPELVKGLDISGTCLGYLSKDRLITGQAVKEGDLLVALRSSGIHSNGLTLARKVVESHGLSLHERVPGLEESVGMELLRPTEIYVRQVLSILENREVHGMVNVTGGGMRNLLRLKRGLCYEIDSPPSPPPIFSLLQDWGDISDEEMYQTFNMGMGFIIVLPEGDAEELVTRHGNASLIGRVSAGEGVLITEGNIRYTNY